MEIVIKTVVLGVVVAVICLVVEKGSPELALLLAVSVTLLLAAYGLGIIAKVTAFIDLITDTAGLSAAVIAPMVKTMGIGILVRMTSDICRDAGQSAIAAGVETVGAAAAVYLALPLMQTVFQMIEELL